MTFLLPIVKPTLSPSSSNVKPPKIHGHPIEQGSNPLILPVCFILRIFSNRKPRKLIATRLKHRLPMRLPVLLTYHSQVQHILIGVLFQRSPSKTHLLLVFSQRSLQNSVIQVEKRPSLFSGAELRWDKQGPDPPRHFNFILFFGN